MKKLISMLLCVLLLLLSGCGKEDAASDIAMQTTVAPTSEAATEANTNEPDFFVYSDNMKIRYEELSFQEESATLETEVVDISLSETDAKAFINSLKIYETQLSDDILKSDFQAYYYVELGNHIDLVIDAAHNTYGSDDVSYMFVRQIKNGILTIYGTYIDLSIVEFLDARR